MADGSSEHRTGPLEMNYLTFSAADPSLNDTKQCSGQNLEGGRLNLSFYTELETSESCENSETRGVVADRSVATATRDSRKTPGSYIDDGDDRKRRCFDRYDSSESSDRLVVVV
ncbi:unnamed protein product [Euphydryas editha]|uniref:Uncharacterized protein n=1 Tax=Euphydryas editha TaxID=104508 RepID=A0AAU9U0P3_EUPED|nr:unnamed protein product [Euphydryas editha]